MPLRPLLFAMAFGSMTLPVAADEQAVAADPSAVAEPAELPDQATDPAPTDAPPGVELEPATELTQPQGAMEEFLESLSILGYSLEEHVAERAMVEALIKSVDPYAKLVKHSDLEAFRAELVAQTAGPVPDEITDEAVDLHLAGVSDLHVYETGHLYIRLSGVYSNTGAALAQKLVQHEDAHHGLILDLRGAAGTSEAQVLRIVSMFPRDAQVAFLLYHYGGETEEMLVPDFMPVWTRAVVVLIDENTSGAAEALAVALSGSKSVLTIGTATRGDGRLRDLVTISVDYVAYMATRRILFPDGTDYSATEVTPDISLNTSEMGTQEVATVKDFDDRALSDRVVKIRDVIRQTGSDPAIQRAISILVGLHALGKSGDEPVHASRD